MITRIMFAAVLVVLFASVSAIAQRDPDTALVYELGATPWDGRIAAIQKLSPERKARLIATIKSESFPEESRQQKQDLLVHLGDEETIQKQADLLVQDAETDNEWLRAIAILQTQLDPRVIAAIAPALFFKDPAAEAIGLHGDRAEVTAGAMLRMLPETPGFNGEVYEWAKRAGGLPYFSIQILREWWKANREHFEKGNYLAVQPGGYPPPDGSYEPYQTAEGVWKMRMKPEAANWTPLPLPQATSGTPTAAISTPAMQPSAPRESQPERTPRLVIVAAAVAALLLIGALWQSTRRQK